MENSVNVVRSAWTVYVHHPVIESDRYVRQAESHVSPDTWKLYVETAIKQDDERYKVWNADLDMILLFVCHVIYATE